jgi:hypothetical protein
MIFAKLYVDVYTHPKFIKAGFEASGYWMHALAYLRHQESSDGFLSEETITVPLAARKAQCKRLCEELVSAGLFRKVEGGYVLLRYAERNETKAEILSARAAARERKSKSRLRAAGSPRTSDSKPSAPMEPMTAPISAIDVTRDTVTSVTEEASDTVTPNRREGVTRSPSIGFVSGIGFVSSIGSDLGSGSESEIARPGGPPARRPLPPSERGMSGSFWLAAFTEGISTKTGRPCTAGRMYLATLERIVGFHAPARDAGSACAWLREQAAAFAAQWDGHHPPKGLTPDGLERWLNEGRAGPPQFGKSKIVQLPPEEWKPDDFSDLGAVVITGERDPEKSDE